MTQPPPIPDPALPRPPSPRSPFISALASLRLTITLLALSLPLIFFGTLAQVEQGIWAVMDQYFRTPIAWIDLDVISALLPVTWDWSWAVPYPGGWLIGGVLVINLTAAHVLRFRLAWRKLGMQLIHIGLIILLISELITGLFAVEGQMSIDEGSSSNFVEDIRTFEFAVIDPRHPDDDFVTAFPEALVRRAAGNPAQRLSHEDLPFDIEVLIFLPNSQLVSVPWAPPNTPNPADIGRGLQWVAQPRRTAAGTDTQQSVDVPSAYITIHDKTTGQPLGTYLVSEYFDEQSSPQFVTIADHHWPIALRFKRTYKSYTLHLLDFTHDRYMGTNIPMGFSSRVRLVDPTQGEDRIVLIYMNSPLRYAGDTLFQSSFKSDDSGTVLQVVDNPGWLIPYVSCSMITVGMIYHFVRRLWMSAQGGAHP
ncbi:MAG: ResB protein required for cytochrome C biosynthesis [Planctomycetaceae bacterium]|nr:ResB protein required for cytochrome C biosynthesis [Planctomycetaceae bacterium]